MIIQMRRRTPPQRRISQSTRNRNIAIWGRQSGKTTFGLDKLVVRPLQGRQHGLYWYVLQTHAAAEIAFNRYLKMIEKTPIFKAKNESEKWTRLINGSTIFFKSGKNFEELRMETLDGVIIDELRLQDPALWPRIIQPMLTRRNGWCDFLTTTNGYDHSYDMHNFALEHPDTWGVFHAPSTEAYWWSDQAIEEARSVMSEDEFAQEIMAEFREVGVGKTYKNHTLAHGVDANPFTGRDDWHEYLPIIVGLDFNVGLMVWELMQKRASEFYIGDEIAVKNTDSEQCAKILVEKVRNHKPGVILIGDASGNARKTSAVGKTDYSIIMQELRDAGIRYENLTPSDNPHVKDRVNCMNSAFRAADGTIRLHYHRKRCTYFKRDCERVKWKESAEGAILDKRDALATHASDAAGYPITYYSELLKQEVGQMKMVRRG